VAKLQKHERWRASGVEFSNLKRLNPLKAKPEGRGIKKKKKKKKF
jgi:hypothetical protein